MLTKWIAFSLVLLAVGCGGATGYDVVVVKSGRHVERERWEQLGAANLVGKTIVEIYGPIAEIRLEGYGVNDTSSGADDNHVREAVRSRIDRAKCLGRKDDIAWHIAPWRLGHILFENGLILPVEIWLSGIYLGGLLFSEG